jgi:hypothetical protein
VRNIEQTELSKSKGREKERIIKLKRGKQKLLLSNLLFCVITEKSLPLHVWLEYFSLYPKSSTRNPLKYT